MTKISIFTFSSSFVKKLIILQTDTEYAKTDKTPEKIFVDHITPKEALLCKHRQL